ncbi:MAG: ribose-5-phosphate isomerase RpiA [Cytophagales bacterium]|nr:ribose-5-phosphate isomerase RpiA [Cytophagales bacterium]
MNAKQTAARKAVEFVQEGMVVGLGTGSTAYWAIQRLGQRVKEGLRIRAIATSLRSETLARELGIPIISFADVQSIDLAIDGADEADPANNLVKGGGGSLLREKIVAAASRTFIVVVDESKLVPQLGAFPLPVEVVPFGWEVTAKTCAGLGCTPTLRMAENQPFVSDNGNYILDCAFGTIAEPATLAVRLNAIPGVVENGLFLGMAGKLVIGRPDGTCTLR